ncbi:Auxin-induced protein X15 [Morella rubra]|uniref:Auxin-induced protein X15 n=1 Tax=Morella rubra TaxID=262757 RepID=A0A6A1WIE8_9ROSI|nr:Auxin-induced protein X15 [Morella rubra]
MKSINLLIKYLGRSHPRNPYNQLGKEEKENTVRVKKGHVMMYVGEVEKRYEVPLKYLSLPAFQVLIDQSQPHELDIKIHGPIVLACSTEVFDQFLSMAEASCRRSSR